MPDRALNLLPDPEDDCISAPDARHSDADRPAILARPKRHTERRKAR